MENGTRIIIKPEVAEAFGLPKGRSGAIRYTVGIRLEVDWDDGKTSPILEDFVDPEQTKV